MMLQRMMYRDPTTDEIEEVVCAVGDYHGGEYTLCGNAIPDNTLENFDAEPVEEEFEGRLKDVTCGECLLHIIFVKSLK
jgi:hypothetical protein